jgi:hypothetical protein
MTTILVFPGNCEKNKNDELCKENADRAKRKQRRIFLNGTQ